MNTTKIIAELKTKYPGKNIIKNGNPVGEIICEVEPSSKHQNYSMAIVIIDKIIPHYHKETTEIYEVTGHDKLVVHKGQKKYILRPGEKITIESGIVHFAEGTETWFKVTSHPGWRLEDHILV